jgi:TonB family protein
MRRIVSIIFLSFAVPAWPAFAQGSTTSCANSPSADTSLFDLTEVTELPIRTRMEPPRLPPAFFRLKVNVQVMLSFIVNKDGTVDTSSVVVVDPQGSALESEAVRVVKKATFSPGCRDHKAVRVRVQMPMHFVSPR